jgi:hypothetical protein
MELLVNVTLAGATPSLSIVKVNFGTTLACGTGKSLSQDDHAIDTTRITKTFKNISFQREF